MTIKKARATNQKKFMEGEVRNFRSFFSAEELHQQLSKNDKKIGIATVYRFLKRFTEEGNIHSYSCGGKMIYSSSIKNHCHFICESCEKIKHISLKNLDFIQKEVKGDICHFQISVTGICEKCKNSKSSDK